VTSAVTYHRIVVTLAVLGAVAAYASLQRLRSTAKRTAERQLPTDARLDARIGHVHLDGRFEDAIDNLASATGTNIVVRWDQLQRGVRKHLVRVERRDVLLGDVLQALLDQVVDATEEPLGFDARDGMVVIGRANKLGTITRFYNVRDFVEEQWPPAAAPATGAAASPVATGGSVFVGGINPEQLDDLSSLIKETVDPEAWRDNGGSVGNLRQLNGVFVITTSWESHRDIERLLAALRQSAAATTNGLAPMARPVFQPGPPSVDVPPLFSESAVEGQPITIRVYDVRGLFRAIWDAERELRQQFFPGRAPERDDDGGVWTAAQLEEAVGTFIKENVMVASWRDNGGGPGAMWVWCGRLIVRHVEDAHFEIDAILKMLEAEFGKDRPPADATSRPAPWPLPPAAARVPSARD
jgi:hypothetical protein